MFGSGLTSQQPSQAKPQNFGFSNQQSNAGFGGQGINAGQQQQRQNNPQAASKARQGGKNKKNASKTGAAGGVQPNNTHSQSSQHLGGNTAQAPQSSFFGSGAASNTPFGQQPQKTSAGGKRQSNRSGSNPSTGPSQQRSGIMPSGGIPFGGVANSMGGHHQSQPQFGGGLIPNQSQAQAFNKQGGAGFGANANSMGRTIVRAKRMVNQQNQMSQPATNQQNQSSANNTFQSATTPFGSQANFGAGFQKGAGKQSRDNKRATNQQTNANQPQQPGTGGFGSGLAGNFGGNPTVNAGNNDQVQQANSFFGGSKAGAATFANQGSPGFGSGPMLQKQLSTQSAKKQHQQQTPPSFGGAGFKNSTVAGGNNKTPGAGMTNSSEQSQQARGATSKTSAFGSGLAGKQKQQSKMQERSSQDQQPPTSMHPPAKSHHQATPAAVAAAATPKPVGGNSSNSTPAPAWATGGATGGHTTSHNANNPTSTNTANKTSKSTLCRNFFGSGSCKFGDNCNFSHAADGSAGDPSLALEMQKISSGNPKAAFGDLTPEMKQRLEKMITEYSSQRPCYYFQQGNCNKGDNCNFSHDNAGHTGNKRQQRQQQQQNNNGHNQQPGIGQRTNNAATSAFGGGAPGAHQMTGGNNMTNQHQTYQEQSNRNTAQGATTVSSEQDGKSALEQSQHLLVRRPSQKKLKESAPSQDDSTINQQNIKHKNVMETMMKARFEENQKQKKQRANIEESKLKKRGSQSSMAAPQQQDKLRNIHRAQRKPSPDREKQASEAALRDQHKKWIISNRDQASSQSQSIYQMNKLEHTEQDFTVLHYFRVLQFLAESEQAQSNLQKAQCMTMCPNEEIYNRSEVEVGAQANFEMKSDGSMFQQLAVKRFGRSAAGKEDNPANNRPPIILYWTFSYLRDCIADQDRIPRGRSYYAYEHGKNEHEFEHIYSFIRDRCRQITQELIINYDLSIYDVRTTEEMVRFLLISYHDCFQGKVFSVVQNSERLTHNLGRLSEAYKLAAIKAKAGQLEPHLLHNINRNKYEMFAYSLIAEAMSIESQSHIMKIKWDEFESDEEINLVKEAIRIQQVIKNGNYVEYFRILRRPSTNYFFACVMLIHIEFMRLVAIEELYRAFRVSGFPFSLIKAKLNLPSEEDAKSLTIAAGYKMSKNPETGRMQFEKRPDQETWKESWKKWRQSSPMTDLDALRGKVRRSRLIQHGMEAFKFSQADIGQANALQDANEIIAFSTEEQSVEEREIVAPPKPSPEEIEKKRQLQKKWIEFGSRLQTKQLLKQLK